MNIIRWLILALGLAMVTLSPAAVVLAQDETEDVGESRATSFEADEGARTEDIPGGGLFIIAYATVWLMVFGYAVSIAFRQAATARDLERLRQDMKAKER